MDGHAGYADDGVTAQPWAMRRDQLDRRLRGTPGRPRSAPRAELLHVLMLPDLERAERIGEIIR
jgi:hypothetical protein